MKFLKRPKKPHIVTFIIQNGDGTWGVDEFKVTVGGTLTIVTPIIASDNRDVVRLNGQVRGVARVVRVD